MELKRRTSGRLVGPLEPQSGPRSPKTKSAMSWRKQSTSRPSRRRAVISGTAGLAALVVNVGGPVPADDRATSLPPLVTIEAVFDGDTVALAGGKVVDLADLDAPELTECHGRLSTWVLRRMLPVGSVVRLKLDRNAKAATGRRPLAFIFRRRSINYLLVANGAANAYVPHRRLDRTEVKLMRASALARAARREAWGACTATSSPYRPWQLQRRRADRSMRNCDKSYPGVCIPSGRSVGDLDCQDIPQYWDFSVKAPDPHHLDGDGDGIACKR
jgi:endonuclease YncB( thermonuclease family)